MALSDVERVRLKIQDIPAIADDTRAGDGTANLFQFAQRNLTSASAFVPGPGGWSATGATFNASGYVEFAGPISAASAFRTRYVYSVFSDAEIGQFLADGGSVNGAAKEAVVALMFDGTRRARWSSPDGTSYDDTAAIGLLKEMRVALDQELQNEAAAGGALESWSMDQELY